MIPAENYEKRKCFPIVQWFNQFQIKRVSYMILSSRVTYQKIGKHMSFRMFSNDSWRKQLKTLGWKPSFQNFLRQPESQKKKYGILSLREFFYDIDFSSYLESYV